MKEYMLITVCMLAGKYVDIPIWLNIFFGISAAWAVRKRNGQAKRRGFRAECWKSCAVLLPQGGNRNE